MLMNNKIIILNQHTRRIFSLLTEIQIIHEDLKKDSSDGNMATDQEKGINVQK